MIGTLRKHSTWLWFVIIFFMIAGLIYVFRPSSNYSGAGGGSYNFGSIAGQKITQDLYVGAIREVNLQFFFRYGQWPSEAGRQRGLSEEQQRREAAVRLMLAQEARNMGISVGSAQVAREANQILAQFARAARSSEPIPLNVFVSRVLQPHGITVGDFERFLRHNLEIQQLSALVTVEGKLITPGEATMLYKRSFQEISTEAAFFDASNYLSHVSVTPATVGRFYTNQLANYRLPDRVQVNYVEFPVSNYLAQSESELVKSNLNDMVEANYERLGTNYFADAKTPEEAKAKIRKELIRIHALSLARQAANVFATTLFDEASPTLQSMAKLASSNGLPFKLTAPFDQETGPKEEGLPMSMTTPAFTLTPDDPFAAEPVEGESEVYVIALNKRLPSEIPPLEKIRAQVTADCRYSEAAQLAREATTNFFVTATNLMAHGKSFTAACTEAKVNAKLLPPLSLSTRELPTVESHLTLNEFKQIAFTALTGQVHFAATDQGGAVVYVESRLPIDKAKMKQEMPEFVKTEEQRRQQEVFNQWLNRQVQEYLQNSPLFQSRNAGQPPAAGS